MDSSATNTSWHDELKGYDLPGLIRTTWPKINELTQPFVLETPAGCILEMPDTAALADYVTAKEMTAHVAKAALRLAKTKQDVFIHLGFHQESAARYSQRITAAIRAIRKVHGEKLLFETLVSSAASVQPPTPPNKSRATK